MGIITQAFREAKASYNNADEPTKKMYSEVGFPTAVMLIVIPIVSVMNGVNFFVGILMAVFLAPFIGMLYYQINLDNETKKMLDAKEKVEQEQREEFYRNRIAND